MTEGDRRELLLKAYDMERQDERSFWSTTVAYMGAAATILVTVTIIAKPSSWGVWAVSPMIGLAFLAYYSQQASIGSRRRVYMEALEVELCSGLPNIEVDGRSVRPMANNRYTWFFCTWEKSISAGSARALFIAMNSIPQLFFLFLLVTSSWRLWDQHLFWSLTVGIIGFLGWALIAFIAVDLASERSRQITWERVDSAA